MIRRLLVVLFGAVVAVLGVPAVASAHTHMETSSPADGAEVDSLPATITLTFGEDIQGPTAQVGVLVDGHDPIQLEAAVSGPNLTIDTATDELADLEADPSGKWAIAYTVVGQDGHAIDGTMTFTVAQSAAADSDESAEDGDSSAAAGETAADQDETGDGASQAADADQQEESMPAWLWLSIVAVIGLVVFGVVKTERLRRKKAEDAEKAAEHKS